MDSQCFQAFGFEMISDAFDVTGPRALGTGDLVCGPYVGSIFAPPVSAHVMSVFLTWTVDDSILGPSETVMREASPMPGAVVERGSLAHGSSGIGDPIHAISRAGS